MARFLRLLPLRRHRLLGGVREELVAAGGPLRLRHLARERAHVGGDHPDLIVRVVAAVGRHAVRPYLDDGVVDVLTAVAVDTLLVLLRWVDASTVEDVA